MNSEEMCRSCKHQIYCIAAFKKDHWCGNRIGSIEPYFNADRANKKGLEESYIDSGFR